MALATIFEKRICRIVARIDSFDVSERVKMRINLNSIFVDDQSKALAFYTDVLGFVPSKDVPVGEFRWLTVRSPEGGETELSLEPNANPAARAFQEALFKQQIPLTAFEVDDLQDEFQRLRAKGVEFTTEPMQAGPVWIAVFSDRCGNLIQIYQRPAG